MTVWKNLVNKHGRKKVWLFTYLVIIGLVVIAMRVLMNYKLYHSALLYVLIPFLISIAITIFRPSAPAKSLWGRYFSHLLTAATILLSTSILIGEGFICVIFFAPIYLFMVTLTYIGRHFTKDKHYALALPAIVLALSMEGITPDLSMPRQSFVEITQSTRLSVAEIKENLAKEFSLDHDRYWLLSVFPMPYRIDAGSLNEGDVHTVYTRYHRWFVTNTHEGKAELLIKEVGDNHVKTEVLTDTTYFSTYLSGSGTEIKLVPNSIGGTDITLRLNYRRNLDPAWYFHPLQKFGVEKMAYMIVEHIMVRSEEV